LIQQSTLKSYYLIQYVTYPVV